MHKLLEILADCNAIYNFMVFINSAIHDKSLDCYYKKIHEVISDLESCPQNPDWHAEGGEFEIAVENTDSITVNVDGYNISGPCEIIKILRCGTAWNHTLYVMDRMKDQLWHDNEPMYDEHTRGLLMLAAFLHDIGKPEAGRQNGKKKPEHLWPSVKGHAEIGAPLAEQFCKDIGLSKEDTETVVWLVQYHMKLHDLAISDDEDEVKEIVTHKNFGFGVLLALADERGCIMTKKNERPGVLAAFADNTILKYIIPRLS